MTNVIGAHNIVSAIREHSTPVRLAIAISTDKACKPINVMGMTKALQERIFVEANLGVGQPRFACVRYGNVVASRGSVVPLFVSVGAALSADTEAPIEPYPQLTRKPAQWSTLALSRKWRHLPCSLFVHSSPLHSRQPSPAGAQAHDPRRLHQPADRSFHAYRVR